MRALHGSESPELPGPMGLVSAPLGAVMIALVALWIAAIPKPLHEVDFDLSGSGCLGPTETALRVHTLAIDAKGGATWDGDELPSRSAIDQRLRAVGEMSTNDQPEIHIVPGEGVGYGAFLSVMAAAQRNGVRNVGVVIGDRLLIRAGAAAV